jgi:hypothetical protein
MLGQISAQAFERSEEAGKGRAIARQRGQGVGQGGHGVRRGLRGGLHGGGALLDGLEPRGGARGSLRRRPSLLQRDVEASRARDNQRRSGEDGDGGAGAGR